MLFFWIFFIKPINFFEFIIQLLILYNIIQLFKQNNFYFLLGYFIFIVIYFSILLIMYNLDLSSCIFLIIYSGIIITFFLYSLLWIDIFKIENIKNNIKKKNFFFFFILLIIIFIYILNIKNNNFNINFFINYYNLININKIKELEILGWGLIYHMTFMNLILSYFLFFNCLIIIIIILNSKKIKNNNIFFIKNFLIKNLNLLKFIFFKNQHFFLQDYENINQNYNLNKIFKIKNKFHIFKNYNRRI